MIVTDELRPQTDTPDAVPTAPGSRWVSFRWALLAIFPLGYLASSQAIAPLPATVLWLTILNAGALVLLLTRLGDPLPKTLWVWSVLLVFLTGVFLKMYWFTSHVNSPRYINDTYLELRWVDRRRILDAYPWATIAFVTFCLAVWGVLTWRRSVALRPPGEGRRELPTAALHLAVALFLFYVGASLLQLRLGYGVLGVANTPLGPFGTLLTFLREQIVLGVLLLCLWVLDRNNPYWASVTVAFIVLTGLIGALLSTSRGVLPAMAATMLLLWLLTGRLTRQRKLGLLCVALAALVLFPILSEDRTRRITQIPGERALPNLDAVVDSGFFMLTRPGGIEGIWHGYDYRGDFSTPRLLKFLRPHYMTDYYTRTVVKVRNENDFRSAGLIGGLMIIGGSGAVIGLMIATVLLLQGFWTVLSRLRSWPVALALAAPAIATFVSGGIELQVLVKVALQCAACEFMYRKLLSRPIVEAQG